uniref:Uncharacterized protein n=1 Tax=Hemiselmis andersenii TaxID=464988 RepID=A0A6U4MXN7_HEMAN
MSRGLRRTAQGAPWFQRPWTQVLAQWVWQPTPKHRTMHLSSSLPQLEELLWLRNHLRHISRRMSSRNSNSHSSSRNSSRNSSNNSISNSNSSRPGRRRQHRPLGPFIHP